MHTKTVIRSLVAAVVVAAPFVAWEGCATSGVNRGDFNLISIDEEWQLGQQMSRDLEGKLRLVDDRSALAYVDRVGQRIVATTEMRNLPWHFHIVADPEVNAFNIPGGHVYVNTGLISAAANVAEFSGVLAHEIGHGVSRHGTEQLSKAYGFDILAGLALGRNPPVYQQILAQVVGAGTFARFSRADEKEADDLGVRYMYNAGYDPRGMVSMFQVLLQRRDSRPGSVEKFFSSHPLTEDRIRDVRAQIQKLPAKSGLIDRDPGYQGLRSDVGRYAH